MHYDSCRLPAASGRCCCLPLQPGCPAGRSCSFGALPPSDSAPARGRGCRYKRGYKNVINKGVELNDEGEACELMMETSGHGALKENRFLDDGAFMSVKIIIEAARRRWQGRQGIKCVVCSVGLPLFCVLCNEGTTSQAPARPQQRRGISTGLASSATSSRTATQTPGRKATQTRTVHETKQLGFVCATVRAWPLN